MQQSINKDAAILLKKLVEYCCTNLKIKKPTILLVNGLKYTQKYKSFASYEPDSNTIRVVIKKRNLADICRSLAHELKHAQQNAKGELQATSGMDGDKWENEANSFAGIIMRKFGRENPKIYTLTL